MNLEQCIVREIEKSNSISFARFMELALYAPELGYYEQKDRVGRGGDFYTSVSVGPLFGELLALQFTEWLSIFQDGSTPEILESGAHDGQLAFDILTSLHTWTPEVFKKVGYCIMEPSAQHEQWQREKLKGFSNVRWVKGWDEVDAFSGVIFSNELLDAFPFHRFQWNAHERNWQEMKVGWDGTQFVWLIAPITIEIPGLPSIPEELAAVLPDGFQIEVSPSALAWWQAATGKLACGRIVAVDYGMTAEEFLAPERSRGTARSYMRHHLGQELLSNPGEQDITGHVNFSALIKMGESQGLETEFFGLQSKFLAGVVGKKLRRAADALDRKFVSQFQTLTHPAHLGAKFKVLVQRKSCCPRVFNG